MSRITATFARLRAKGEMALIPYLTAGDPSLEVTRELVIEAEARGADLIELGFPFSDPVADGPVIQAAGQRAIGRFRGLDDYLDLVTRIRAATPVPLVSMTYYNPIFRYGEQAFLERARACGLDGVIIPDLPLDEGLEWRERCVAHGIAPIYLEAPNTTPEHAEAIAHASQGFIYLVSLKGVTGASRGLGENLEERIARLRGFVETPLLVGFGISTPEQARAIGRLADGVIVGSALVGLVERSASDAEGALTDFLQRLRDALSVARPAESKASPFPPRR